MEKKKYCFICEGHYNPSFFDDYGDLKSDHSKSVENPENFLIDIVYYDKWNESGYVHEECWISQAKKIRTLR